MLPTSRETGEVPSTSLRAGGGAQFLRSDEDVKPYTRA